VQAIYRLTLAVSVFVAFPAWAETVDVRYFGVVDLASYECADITRSSFVNRVCYDEAEQHMVVQLRETYYAYWRERDGSFHGCRLLGALLQRER
jgi:hypothetical protein